MQKGLQIERPCRTVLEPRDRFDARDQCRIAGPDAAAKARLAGDALLRRLDYTFERSHVECVGAGACAPGILTGDPAEVVLRLAVQDSRRDMVERFTKEFAPLVTSGPPGITGYTTGRPSVREVFAYWPALIAKKAVTPQVEVLA